MKKIRILDLCCKAGGASMGYALAARALGIPFEIVGVDIAPQPHFPFSFIEGDALEWGPRLGEFDFIHASPPCQKHSSATAQFRKKGKVYADLIDPVREMLERSGIPAVIENVPSAPLRRDLVLRGDQFGLGVIRRRIFEGVNVMLLKPAAPGKLRGGVLTGDFVSVFGNGSLRPTKELPKSFRPKHYRGSVRETWRGAMGIDWMFELELAEAIPPAYTRFIGEQLFPNLFLKKSPAAPAAQISLFA